MHTFTCAGLNNMNRILTNRKAELHHKLFMTRVAVELPHEEAEDVVADHELQITTQWFHDWRCSYLAGPESTKATKRRKHLLRLCMANLELSQTLPEGLRS